MSISHLVAMIELVLSFILPNTWNGEGSKRIYDMGKEQIRCTLRPESWGWSLEVLLITELK